MARTKKRIMDVEAEPVHDTSDQEQIVHDADEGSENLDGGSGIDPDIFVPYDGIIQGEDSPIYPVFCTVDIPLDVVNQFITATSSSLAPDDSAEEAPRFVFPTSLESFTDLTPSKYVGGGRVKLLQALPSPNPFLGMSIEQLARTLPPLALGTHIYGSSFIVLDDRTSELQCCTLVTTKPKWNRNRTALRSQKVPILQAPIAWNLAMSLLINFEIANMDMEEIVDCAAEAPDGVARF